MAFFNLKQAMANPYGGSTHYKNREPLRWWDYKDLISSPKLTGQQAPASLDRPDAEVIDPIDQWLLWAEQDKSLSKLLRDAGIYRDRNIHDIAKEYGISVEQADSMTKTFLGYHPSYGGYICQVAPYVSEGYIWGKEHVKNEGKTKFAPFILPRKRASSDDIKRALMLNIQKYTEAFGIKLTPDDFGFKVVGPAKETYDPNRGTAEKRVVEEYIPSLATRNNPALADFEQRAPMVGIGSRIDFNAKGWKKILTKLFGNQYEAALAEKARQEGKSEDQILSDMVFSADLVRSVYQKALDNYNAVPEEERAALGMTAPPSYDMFKKATRSKFGAQGFSALEPNTIMAEQVALKIEILDVYKGGLTDPQAIADKLNNDPVRKAANSRRKYKAKLKGEEFNPTVITADEVSRHISEATHEMQDKKINMDQVIQNTRDFASKMLMSTGYDDLKTAMEVASLKWSTDAKDLSTGSRMGELTARTFSLSEGAPNPTSEELRGAQETKEDEEARAKGLPPPIRERPVSPEQIQKDIGKNMPTPEKTLAPAVPAEGIKEEVPVATPAPETTEVTPPPVTTPKKKKKVVHDIEEEMRRMMGDTLERLIRVAEELDLDNKDQEAEEVHKIIRKYVERL